MDPYIAEVARNLDGYRDETTITHILDELEFLYEAVGVADQARISHLIEVLSERLQALA
jgi:hypothetical protein